MVRPRTLIRLVAAAVLAAAAYAGVPLAPAAAATCPTADGVTVVVDFHQLGGGVQTSCVAGGGGDSAASLFPAAGYALTYVQRTPGFVCRVSGIPADDPCVNTPPADAYWGLWWSDGKSGTWNYATAGAASLHVPEGGYVAFSWNGTSTRSAPGATPTPHRPVTPTQPPSPSHSSTAGPAPEQPAPSTTATPTSAPPDTTGSASTSAEPTKKPARHGDRSASAQPSPSASTVPAPASESADAVPASAEPAEPADGLPTWVAPAVIVVLFGAAGAVAVVRRRRGAA